MHEVRITPEGLRHLHQLPAKVRDAALAVPRGPVAENPHRMGKPLVGALAGLFSARRGDYRIIYSIDDSAKVVTVHRIQHRGSVYRRRVAGDHCLDQERGAGPDVPKDTTRRRCGPRPTTAGLPRCGLWLDRPERRVFRVRGGPRRVEEGDRRTRLRARAAALGVLQSAPGPVVSPHRRRRIVASTKGTGPVIDQLLDEERERV